jgi:hypothetical protein
MGNIVQNFELFGLLGNSQIYTRPFSGFRKTTVWRIFGMGGKSLPCTLADKCSGFTGRRL